MSERCIVLGAGGHGKVVIDALLVAGGLTPIGILDTNSALHHSVICGVKVLGGDDLMPHLLVDGVWKAICGVGGISDNRPRKAVIALARGNGFEVCGLIHPAAYVSRFAKIHGAAQIFAGAHVGPSAEIEDGTIINTHAVIDHDCIVKAFAHIAPGAILGGGVTVGTMAHIGSGATIRQNIKIGAHAVVGAGAVVVRDVAEGDVVVGVPARSMSISQQ